MQRPGESANRRVEPHVFCYSKVNLVEEIMVLRDNSEIEKQLAAAEEKVLEYRKKVAELRRQSPQQEVGE